MVRTLRIALAAAVAMTLVGCSVFSDGSEPPTSRAPSPSVSASAEPFELSMELGDVAGRGPDGTMRGGALGDAARRVRDALEAIYSVGFVDTTAWDGGRFPDLEDGFAGDARKSARHDVAELTLGAAADVVDAVRPDRARVDVQVLADGAGRPVAAFASVRFEATAIAGDVTLPVRHEGDFTLRRIDRDWRVVAYDVRGRVPTERDVRTKVRTAEAMPEVPAKDLLFVLVIGSDARPGQPVRRTRADSLHIVGIDPKLGRASIVGIPRDSYVVIPGFGVDKINASLVRGGPQLVVRTVERLAGLHIDAYVLTGFRGFERAVSAVGGIEVKVPYLMADPGMPTLRPGRTRLSGREALAFGRNRHDAPGGDFGRSLNQGRLLAAALAELQHDIREDPANLIAWAVAAARYLETDLTFADIVDLSLAARSVDVGRVRNTVVPGSVRTISGRSVVVLGQGARAIFRDLAADALLGG